MHTDNQSTLQLWKTNRLLRVARALWVDDSAEAFSVSPSDCFASSLFLSECLASVLFLTSDCLDSTGFVKTAPVVVFVSLVTFFEMLDDVSCFSCYLYSILPNITLLMLLPLFLTAASAAISNACVASWYHEAKSYTWLSCGYMNVNATEYFFSHVDGVFVSKLNCTLSSNLKSREVASHVRPTKDACEWIGILSDAANMVNEDEQFGLNFCTWGTRCAKTLSRKFWKILPCVAIYANFLFLFYCSTALRLKILKTPNCLLRLKKWTNQTAYLMKSLFFGILGSSICWLVDLWETYSIEYFMLVTASTVGPVQ